MTWLHLHSMRFKPGEYGGRYSTRTCRRANSPGQPVATASGPVAAILLRVLSIGRRNRRQPSLNLLLQPRLLRYLRRRDEILRLRLFRGSSPCVTCAVPPEGGNERRPPYQENACRGDAPGKTATAGEKHGHPPGGRQRCAAVNLLKLMRGQERRLENGDSGGWLGNAT